MDNERPKKTKPCKYPRSLFHTGRTYDSGVTKGFTVTPFLYMTDPEQGESPYETHGKFSRFQLAITDSSKTPGSVTANISYPEIPAFLVMAEAAMDKIALYEPAAPKPVQNSGNASGPAYTETLSFGPYKGQTPAGALLADGEKAVESLQKNAEILQQNVGKFPANKKKIDAINSAIGMFREGKLSGTAVPSSSAGQWRRQLHYSGPRGSVEKQSAYELTITAVMEGKKKNFEFAIEAYDAPVTKMEGGQLNVKKSEAQNKRAMTFTLDFSEFALLIAQIRSHLAEFEVICAPAIFLAADYYDKKENGEFTLPPSTPQYDKREFTQTLSKTVSNFISNCTWKALKLFHAKSSQGEEKHGQTAEQQTKKTDNNGPKWDSVR